MFTTEIGTCWQGSLVNIGLFVNRNMSEVVHFNKGILVSLADEMFVLSKEMLRNFLLMDTCAVIMVFNQFTCSHF
jgi:hypothetical protein